MIPQHTRCQGVLAHTMIQEITAWKILSPNVLFSQELSKVAARLRQIILSQIITKKMEMIVILLAKITINISLAEDA